MRRVTRTATALAVAAVLAVGLSGCNAIGDIISGASEDDVFSLAVGDCFDSNTETDTGEDIESVPTIECSKPHDYEVFSSVKMDDGDYPGEDDTIAQADALCLSGFETFVGQTYDEAVSYDFTYFYPSTDSWELGDREILCMIVEIDADGNIVKVTDSLKGVGA